ncbi:uncharacterized protein SPEM2 [Sorex fumeus]|uniref:uncharacterized protein SPEM2 n=1 Tax=Sorex fumeus TaxID=62283 RepID=UPI0024AE3EFC|nr:uncharacterized protein SPEM2 [Sorex fumeus]
MESQLRYNILGNCNQYQESPLDAEASLLLLLGLILFVNIGINVTTMMWHRLQNALDKMISWTNKKSEPTKPPESCPKDHPAKAQDLHIHCSLDPVEVKLAQSTSFSSFHHLQNLSCQRHCRPPRHRSRRHHHHHHHRRPHHRSPRRTCPHHRPCSHQPKQFPQNGSVFHSKQHCYRRLHAPSSNGEDLQVYLEEDDLSYPRPKKPQRPWGGLCKRLDLASNMELWGRSGGILASLPPPSLYLSPELRLMPKRVEAKSELRLQTYRPHSSQSHIWENVEAEQCTLPPPPPRRLPLNSSCAPGMHSPYPSRGHLMYDSWHQRRHCQQSSEVPCALVPRGSRPETREHHSPHSHRRSLPSAIYCQPNRSPHSSMAHLSHNSRETHDGRRRAAEWAEALPARHPLTTSTSLSVLNEIPCQRGSVPNSVMPPHSSQPSPEVQTAEPPTPAPTFVPLSRSPGDKANHQVYDSLELKRQVQESRARANSLPSPSTLASRPSLQRSRNMKHN